MVVAKLFIELIWVAIGFDYWFYVRATFLFPGTNASKQASKFFEMKMK